jgi:hypothetical protein
MSPGVRVEIDEIRGVLASEVLKREVLEGEKAVAAGKQVAKAAGKMLRASRTESRLETEAAKSAELASPRKRQRSERDARLVAE